MIDKDGIIQTDKTKITTIIQDYYKEFYAETQVQPVYYQHNESEEIPDITISEIKLGLKQIKVEKTIEDGITSEMMRLSGRATIKAIQTFLNKCLHWNQIPEQWQNAKLDLLHKEIKSESRTIDQ